MLVAPCVDIEAGMTMGASPSPSPPPPAPPPPPPVVGGPNEEGAGTETSGEGHAPPAEAFLSGTFLLLAGAAGPSPSPHRRPPPAAAAHSSPIPRQKIPPPPNPAPLLLPCPRGELYSRGRRRYSWTVDSSSRASRRPHRPSSSLTSARKHFLVFSFSSSFPPLRWFRGWNPSAQQWLCCAQNHQKRRISMLERGRTSAGRTPEPHHVKLNLIRAAENGRNIPSLTRFPSRPGRPQPPSEPLPRSPIIRVLILLDSALTSRRLRTPI